MTDPGEPTKDANVMGLFLLTTDGHLEITLRDAAGQATTLALAGGEQLSLHISGGNVATLSFSWQPAPWPFAADDFDFLK